MVDIDIDIILFSCSSQIKGYLFHSSVYHYHCFLWAINEIKVLDRAKIQSGFGPVVLHI